jgi:hypothetical protein
MQEGEWNLSYPGNGLLPGANFTFGTFASGYELLEPAEFKDSDGDAGDVAMPHEDGQRLGQDTRGHATLTFEVGVDTVGHALAARARHGANLASVSAMKEAWDGEAIRGRFGVPAVLRTVQGGRARRFYGRPRKCEPAASKLTRQGHTPVIATFTCVDTLSYDDVEKITRVDMAPPPHRGLVGPLKDPLSMTGEGATKTPGEVLVGGTKPTWPVITIYGPISQPVCELVARPRVPASGGQPEIPAHPGWKVALNLSLNAGERVTIDPRPWARTVLRNGFSNAAGLLTRSSPRLKDVRLPTGRSDFVLRGRDTTGQSYMTIAWRDAYAWL